MRKLLFAPVALLTLTAAMCHDPTQPGVEVRVVKVPTPAPCVPLSEIPVEPEQVGPMLTGNAAADLAIVAASALELRAWGKGMASDLRACAGEE